MADIIGQLGRDADRVVSVDVKRPSPESVFMALTGRRYSADETPDTAEPAGTGDTVGAVDADEAGG